MWKGLQFRKYVKHKCEYLRFTLNGVLGELDCDHTKRVLELEGDPGRVFLVNHTELQHIIIFCVRVVNDSYGNVVLTELGKCIDAYLSISMGSVLGMFNEGMPVFIYGLKQITG